MADGPEMPLPPGFEAYSAPASLYDDGAEEEVDEAEIADFQSFMASSLGPSGASASSSAPAPRSATGAELARLAAQHVHASEATATVEVYDADGEVTNLLDPNMTFEDLGLPEPLLRGIYEMGFVRPSKIQAAALPLIGCSRAKNMIGQAQNGSGKTATFSLALLSVIDVNVWLPQAMVICPTRELARQNEAVIAQLGQFLKVETLLVVPAMERLPRRGEVTQHVLVGTPGKIADLVKKGIIDTSSIKVFVLDEADVMLDQDQQMGPQVTQIRKLMNKDLQVLFFSATYPDDVRLFAEKLVPQAISIKVRKTDLTVSTVTQLCVHCASEAEKLEKLMALYGAMNVGQSIIFVNARRKAFALAKDLRDANHSVSLICGTQNSGDERMDPSLRDQVMDEFRNGVTRVLIATDVLSRGIDVPQVTLVVNYELPVHYHEGGVEMETYLHRVGRTGRFGLRGIAVNLVTAAQRPMVDSICSFFGCSIPDMGDDIEALEEKLRQLR
mmetsp:Transcript_10840/g.38009  ORF Transcript_10840/g.38009 Transcript_10840/m.38009 type:complete len:500 (-) Transcript_10840:133-1632(-)